MKKFLRWTGIILGALAGIVIIMLGVVSFKAGGRLAKVYHLPEENISIPDDPSSIVRGRHIFQFRGCEACHSEGGFLDLTQSAPASNSHLNLPTQDVPHMEGNIYLDDPALGQVVASNLTSGRGGVASGYADNDWVRAIRHGVRPDGTPLLFMPATEFYFLSDEDLGQVIAYIKSAPPVDHELPKSTLYLMGKVVMTLVPSITFIPAELIPQASPRPLAPEIDVTPQYGEYLTYSCKVCHGLTMSGGPIPGFPSTWPEAPNLTFGDGSVLPAWTVEGFANTIRTGLTPEGRKLRREYMPWGSYKFMNDEELQAVWVYLGSLPKKDYGNR